MHVCYETPTSERLLFFISTLFNVFIYKMCLSSTADFKNASAVNRCNADDSHSLQTSLTYSAHYHQW